MESEIKLPHTERYKVEMTNLINDLEQWQSEWRATILSKSMTKEEKTILFNLYETEIAKIQEKIIVLFHENKSY